MKIYKLTDIKVMGDDETYGKTFWCAAEGVDMPIKFNKKVDVILDGTTIMAQEVTEKTSAKGITYLQLKGVQLEEASQESVPFTEKTENKPQPVFKMDNKRDITKSMAVKLAYVEWVRCEGMLPTDIDHWNIIQANARNLMWTIDGLDDEPVEDFSDAEPGRTKARKVREELDADTEEDN